MTAAGEPAGALDGIRVADFSRVLAGPLCTMILGDLGADVIKVERPDGGDETRGWGPPFVGEDAAYFLSVNRNKRSVALDLDDPGHREAARRLALASDVLVENLKPGGMARFGLGYDLDDKAGKATVRQLIGYWIKAGSLVVVDGETDKREIKKFVRLAEMVE